MQINLSTSNNTWGNWCNCAKFHWTNASNSRTFDITFGRSNYIVIFPFKLVHITDVMLLYPKDNLGAIQLVAPTCE